MEVAKLKAKKIKEGPKSEEEVKDALDDLESNLDPTKVIRTLPGKKFGPYFNCSQFSKLSPNIVNLVPILDLPCSSQNFGPNGSSGQEVLSRSWV